jgi:GTP-binding protein HflX
VLQELGIEEKDSLLVMNKIDQANEAMLESLRNRYPNALFVSAVSRAGFDELHSGVSDALSRTFLNVDIRFPVSNGKLLAYLADKGEILSRQYDEEFVLVNCRLSPGDLGRISNAEATITRHLPSGWIDADEADADAKAIQSVEADDANLNSTDPTLNREAS